MGRWAEQRISFYQLLGAYTEIANLILELTLLIFQCLDAASSTDRLGVHN